MGIFTTTKEQPTLRGKAKDAAKAKTSEWRDKATDRIGRTNRCEVCGRAVKHLAKAGRGTGEGVRCGRSACLKAGF